MVSLEDAQARFPLSAQEPTSANGTQQRVYTYTVSRTNASNITFYVDGTVPADWITALDQAIANWNNTNSLIHMSRVTGTTTTTSGTGKGKKNTTTTTTSTPSYNVLVTTMYDANTTTIAQAYYPQYTGTAGKQVTVNTYYNYLSASYKVFAMTHELGHTIGLTHTDQTYGSLIPGTPETDPNSVMNSFVLPWNGFTPYDITAVTTVYPK
jgi:predicted Zn-dependent protease